MRGSTDTEALVSRKVVYRKVSSEVSGTTREGSDPVRYRYRADRTGIAPACQSLVRRAGKRLGGLG
mgnify:CR=1